MEPPLDRSCGGRKGVICFWREGLGAALGPELRGEKGGYSPANFVTPPFPGYVSGHSAISGACAQMLKHFTGNDHCGLTESRTAGEITEQGFSCEIMQAMHGKPLAEMIGGEALTCDITLQLPTFTEVGELAGISRVLGGYHIQADNVAGLKLGREVSDYLWPKFQQYYDGTAPVMVFEK